MRKHFTYIFAALLILAGGLTGCKKDKDLSVSPGSINGKYNPPGAAAGIVAIKISDNNHTVAKLDSSNHFSITGLQPGNYKIGFAAVPGFIAPDTIAVTVEAGRNFDMGTVLFKKADSSGTGTYGSISGKITPAAAASGMMVRSIWGGNSLYSAIPDANGNFKIDSILPGEYLVSFTTALGFTAPNIGTTTVTAGKNTDIGSVVFNPIVVTPKAIDTIPGTVFLSSAESLNYFITRANADSAIVITGILWLTREVTPELAGALNKIIVIKQVLYIGSAANTAITFNSLKELGQLYINGAGSLTSVDLSALKTLTSGILMYGCPALSTLKIGALNGFAGSLTLAGTGFKDLSAFKLAMYMPFSLDIENNQQLTSLKDLNFGSDSVYNCTITGNPLLTSLDGLQGIKRFKNETAISGNAALQTLTGLDNIIVAKQLTLTDNPQLNAVCSAKQLVNILKDAAPYQVSQINQNTNQVTYITKQPLVASSNGAYATREDLVTAIGQCP